MSESQPHRIHTIVLTRDRPDSLRRCVHELVQQLDRHDALTVLNDSAAESTAASADILSATVGCASCALRHLEWRTISVALKSRLDAGDSEWLVRTYDRDIAPLRNFSLLLAAAVPCETVVLVDDDIVDAAPRVMHEEICGLRNEGTGVVLGAHIQGVSQLDIITRLWQGVDVLGQAIDVRECEPKSVFSASASVAPELQVAGRYPSGGCLGFSLGPDQMTAFPPGYNEDWIWSLLRSDRPDVQVAWSSHRVMHDPPSVRRPTDADCMFELTGDLALDCLESMVFPNVVGPIERLAKLAETEPAADLLPQSRLQEFRKGLTNANLKEDARSILLEHGLESLERLSSTGALDEDWGARIAAWCRSASIAARSFDAVLADAESLKHVRSEWTEGQVR